MVPIAVKYRCNLHRPIIKIMLPRVCKMVRIRMGIWWCLGTGLLLRSDQNFSPSTDLEPQLSKCLGFLNKVGFINSHISKIIIGMRQYHPIQTRDQMATIKNGKVANRVHIDQGLACFIQLSPSKLKAFAICFSILMGPRLFLGSVTLYWGGIWHRRFPIYPFIADILLPK